jgi:hypothetical protein
MDATSVVQAIADWKKNMETPFWGVALYWLSSLGHSNKPKIHTPQ